MRKLVIAGCVSMMVILGCAGTQPRQAVSDPPVITPVWQTPQALEVPESVIYDADRQMLYVANVAGKPIERNGKGFISQVTLDGKIKKLRWATGMDAPKGMGIFEDTLYAADIDRIHAIDIHTGGIIKTWPVKGAKMLNDITIDKKGLVYVTDSFGKAVYVLHGGDISLFTPVAQNGLNGALMDGDRLLVGTAAGLLSIDPATKSATMIIEQAGIIDGLKSLGDGRYITSNWLGRTQVIQKGKPPLILIDTTKERVNTADLEFIPEKGLLLIPTFNDNRVAAYTLR